MPDGLTDCNTCDAMVMDVHRLQERLRKNAELDALRLDALNEALDAVRDLAAAAAPHRCAVCREALRRHAHTIRSAKESATPTPPSKETR